MDQDDVMDRAYTVAGKVLRDRMRAERPDDARELDSVTAAEVAVVGGQYDRIERVMAATGVPYTGVAPEGAQHLDWEKLQVLLVNCPGVLPRTLLERIGPWVRKGGYLLTTDWALKNVIEALFPGTVRHNGVQTTDAVVRVHREGSEDDPLISGFLEPGGDPLWWLESASYPIEVLDPQRVRVLLRSGEVGRQWGADPVIVTFEEGHGSVVHMLSHLYLQRSDVRNAQDAQPASAYLGVAGYGPEAMAFCQDVAPGLRSSELKSATSSAKFLSDSVLRQRYKAKGESR